MVALSLWIHRLHHLLMYTYMFMYVNTHIIIHCTSTVHAFIHVHVHISIRVYTCYDYWRRNCYSLLTGTQDELPSNEPVNETTYLACTNKADSYAFTNMSTASSLAGKDAASLPNRGKSHGMLLRKKTVH